MEKQAPKNESPACACGKGDLYGEWLKMQENEKEGISGSAETKQADEPNNSDDDSGNKDKNPVPEKK